MPPTGDETGPDQSGERLSVPYLSVVAATRNDDHGGGMTRRMQIFVNALAAQSARHSLPCELVLVEWNPPGDRPPLAEALRWPERDEFFQVRIITVSETVHRRFRHPDQLPLHQMVAKNVGIRRATGPFVLATNVDLIFSDPLMAYLGACRLESGAVYRSDRVDVDRNVPLEAGIDEQLEYCRAHVHCVNASDGIRMAPADGLPHGIEDAVLLESGAGTERVKRRLRETDAGRALLRTGAWAVIGRAWRVMQRARFVARIAWMKGEAHAEARAQRLGLTAQQVVDELRMPLRRIPDLHTSACGDFTLMSREAWSVVDGYPEFEGYPLHLDSLAMYVAHARGIREERLANTMVHYHMDHASDWMTNDYHATYRRFLARGVPIMLPGTVAGWAERLRRDPSLQLNEAGWGLLDENLPEVRIR